MKAATTIFALTLASILGTAALNPEARIVRGQIVEDRDYPLIEAPIGEENHSESIKLGMVMIPSNQYEISPEMQALLRIIAEAEGADYNVMYGGRTFTDLSNHPIYTGEMDQGGNLRWGRRATAAGAYMFNQVKFDELVEEGYFGKGFTPEEQDRAAQHIITEDRGVSQEDLEAAVRSRDFNSVLRRLSREWSALPAPGNDRGRYRQGSTTMEEFTNRFFENYDLSHNNQP